ncbi:hypothetical protein [Kribbella sp. NPDC023855]|uniref:hypothetical protein n=1 Tax=Kribbella sp. NPDC023855 TaxID=3154698 RepID=UPI0034112E69
MARKERDSSRGKGSRGHHAREPERLEDDPGARPTGQRPRPPEPNGWRSVINSDYEYPEELDELSRRERRQAKKNWRRDDHAARIAWLRNQRQAEPVSPAAIVVLVVLVMIVILGLGGGLPRILGGDDGDKQPIGLLTPARSVALPTPPAGTTTSESPSTSPTLSVPPPESRRPPAATTADATRLVETWARAFYTRDPASESYSQLINKCAQYVTPGVAASFASAGDSTYDALKASNGKSSVVSAVAGAPREDAAPVDTPNRITRLLKVTIATTGTKPQRFEVPLLVTVSLQDDRWLISDVSGGTGP